MPREPITILELDYEGCALAFGVGACPAALGGAVVRKCYNTFATCKAKDAFAPVMKTLRFADPRANLPKGETIFPALASVSEYAATVNIAGTDALAGSLGRRATVAVELLDFPYHDRLTDPYQSERISGAAQIDEAGYDPATRGTFFGKLRARWPYYTGRPLRVLQGFVDGGALSGVITRNYVLTDWAGPDGAGRVKLEASDVLDLIGNDRALAPKPSAGVLAAAVTAGAASLTLSPDGIGAAEYPAAGRACIGSEIVSYTRVGDVVTLTGRGVAKTVAASHAAGDTFQQVLWFDGVRIDDALEILLRDFGNVPASFIPKAAQWTPEITRWLPQILLRTHICQPTGVAKLVGELLVLGFSLFPDVTGSSLILKVNRPPDGETVYDLSDRNNIKAITPEDRNATRLTEVVFYSVQLDPTKSATDASNYARGIGTYDFEAKSARAYADTRARKIFCRWFNEGADGEIVVLSKRLLNRFRLAPVQYRIKLDAKDSAIGLADLATITSSGLQDEAGRGVAVPVQIVGRSEPVPGHEIELIAQAYDFAGRYAYATDDARPSYAASSAAQRARGFYACDDLTLKMSNGDEPYRAI